ncbi:hypothetical protein KIK84_04560 [Curvibacter sp. CHRR-16]|uniref:hypothetical protein n=1 Tax=Curvibacter sp. CHRR-16 TaxID=2835872 RepID=UPI001BD9C6FE|nr:hypothetical protein [Curvibacter sp. CHRR-16]MBT0569585.1 hypothetical protein [Curvibacter sp. CHRR-16]
MEHAQTASGDGCNKTALKYNHVFLTKRNMKNHIATIFAISVLAACGGGGDSSSSSGTDNVSKYVGTWKTACWTSSIYKDTSNSNASAYLTRTFVISKASNSKLSVSVTDTVYASTDTGCTGSVEATITRTGQNTGTFTSNSTSITSSLGENSFTYAGVASITGASGADNFDVVSAALSSTSNATFTVGNISLNSSDFTGGSAKTALYLSGSTLQLGQSTGNTNYPTALNTTASAIFTKQ